MGSNISFILFFIGLSESFFMWRMRSLFSFFCVSSSQNSGTRLIHFLVSYPIDHRLKSKYRQSVVIGWFEVKYDDLLRKAQL